MLNTIIMLPFYKIPYHTLTLSIQSVYTVIVLQDNQHLTKLSITPVYTHHSNHI